MTVTDSLRAPSADRHLRPQCPTLKLSPDAANWRPAPRKLAPVLMPFARCLAASRARTELLPCFGGDECASEVG